MIICKNAIKHLSAVKSTKAKELRDMINKEINLVAQSAWLNYNNKIKIQPKILLMLLIKGLRDIHKQ